jgi:hypothetical protein
MTRETSKAVGQAFAAAVLVVGVAVFVRGVWLAWRPGGWMVAGLALAAPALFWLYGEIRKATVASRGR